MQERNKTHHPPHYFAGKEVYFITASTYQKKSLFAEEKAKEMLKGVLREKAEFFGVRIYAFALMDSHYHLLAKLPKGEVLTEFIHGVNGKSAFLLNKMEQRPKRLVWYNYWDRCIRTESDFWTRFNYIHHNPIKHAAADKMEDYRYSSYGKWLEKEGKEWMNDVFGSHPIVDFTKGDE